VSELLTPDLHDARAVRPGLAEAEASELVDLFKVLASDTRVRLLVALQAAGEMRVTDLATTVGVSTQAVSNQLQRLVDRRIVAARRDANNAYYRIIDSCVSEMLDAARCAVEHAKASQ
jgi:ArsR family transcriptional regulator, lead/cadmium/zinc/bismuth-responsive transcriptional repressor